MKINEDVHNYMETLVGQKLATDEFILNYSNEQLADIACLALNQTRPIYIRYDIDFLASLPEERLAVLKQAAHVAIKSSIDLIKNDRRQNRLEDIPTIKYDGTARNSDELEWFEESLLKSKNKLL